MENNWYDKLYVVYVIKKSHERKQMEKNYEISSVDKLTSKDLSIDDLRAVEYQAGSGLYILNPFIDKDDVCVTKAYKSSMYSVHVKDKPMALVAYGFGEDPIVECESQRENYVGGYIQKDFKCMDSEALELVRCGENMLSLTAENPMLIFPFPNTTYIFVNHTAKKLYVELKELFYNPSTIATLPCCCAPVNCESCK